MFTEVQSMSAYFGTISQVIRVGFQISLDTPLLGNKDSTVYFGKEMFDDPEYESLFEVESGDEHEFSGPIK